MRLGVKVGKGCAALVNYKMRKLSCQNIQVDELWGFIGKKERHVQPADDPQLGDVWTFCAIDADTKLVPAFKVGKRDAATANAFVSDVASRLKNRVQFSSDAFGLMSRRWNWRLARTLITLKSSRPMAPMTSKARSASTALPSLFQSKNGVSPDP